MKRLALIMSLILVAFMLLAGCQNDSKGKEPQPQPGVIVDGGGDSKDPGSTNPKPQTPEDTRTNISVQWNENSCYATYKVQGEEVAFSAHTVEGYTFFGWYLDASYADAPISVSNEFTRTMSYVENHAEGDTFTIYARFGALHTIRYEMNEGTFIGENPLKSYNADLGDVTLPENVQREGYRFTGWRLGTTGCMADHIPQGTSGAITVSAIWMPEENADELANTVWAYEDANMEMIFVFNGDGTMDYFVKDQKMSYFINGGAIMNGFAAFHSKSLSSQYISDETVRNIKYRCDMPYYRYTRTEDGYYVPSLIKSALSEPDSLFLTYLNTMLPIDIMTFTLSDANTLGLVIAQEEPSVTYHGTHYTMEEWSVFVMKNFDRTSSAGWPAEGEVEFEIKRGETVAGTLRKISSDAGKYRIPAFSNTDVASTNLEADGWVVFEGGFLYISHFSSESNKYMMSGCAFCKDEQVFLSQGYMFYGCMFIPSYYFLVYDLEDLPEAQIPTPFWFNTVFLGEEE